MPDFHPIDQRSPVRRREFRQAAVIGSKEMQTHANATLFYPISLNFHP